MWERPDTPGEDGRNEGGLVGSAFCGAQKICVHLYIYIYVCCNKVADADGVYCTVSFSSGNFINLLFYERVGTSDFTILKLK